MLLQILPTFIVLFNLLSKRCSTKLTEIAATLDLPKMQLFSLVKLRSMQYVFNQNV